MEMLFLLLKLSLNMNKDEVEYSSHVLKNNKNENWKQLFNLSIRQGVLLLSYEGIQYLPASLQPPRNLKLRWCVNVVKGKERYDHYKEVITKLSGLFFNNNLKLVLIKGITIAELYPVPSLRESGDIDICLLEKAGQVDNLLETLGVRKEKGIPKHTTFFIDGIPIENHYTFFDTSLTFRRERQLYQKMENILKGMLSEESYISINENNIFQLPPQAAALYIIGHTFRHFCCLDTNIRQLCDWTIFFSKYKNNIDYELLSSQVCELGLNDFVSHINDFCFLKLGFRPYFMASPKMDTKAELMILKTIMRYRVTPVIHVPVIGVIAYLFRRNNLYKRYLGRVNLSEFLLPELKSYFLYLLKKRWRRVKKEIEA
ncbi:nucleotidyltransferase domain-containing protein [Dysgonomonas termitidis]|uniref:Nucleotidyltransferase family protein n=2 Tax=Dysgonomonas termitidis TaxID=1516126 RepID=A0ABV9KV50_9BACT